MPLPLLDRYAARFNMYVDSPQTANMFFQRWYKSFPHDDSSIQVLLIDRKFALNGKFIVKWRGNPSAQTYSYSWNTDNLFHYNDETANWDNLIVS